MLNDTQIALLNCFIAIDGIYIETITNYENINLGTKILYLKRAINEDDITFFQTLDYLYQDEAQLELIRAFIFINILATNSDIIYEIQGKKSIFKHFFGQLDNYPETAQGHLKASSAISDMKYRVVKMINDAIISMTGNYSEAVNHQIELRKNRETQMIRNTGWRREFYLPENLTSQSSININNQLAPELTRNIRNKVLHMFRGKLIKNDSLSGLIEDLSAPTNTRATVFQFERHYPDEKQPNTFFENSAREELTHEFTRLPLWVEELLRAIVKSPEIKLRILNEKIAYLPRNQNVLNERSRLLVANSSYSRLLKGKLLRKEFARLPIEACKELRRLDNLVNDYPNDLKTRLSRAQLLASFDYYDYAMPDLNYILDREPNNIDAQWTCKSVTQHLTHH